MSLTHRPYVGHELRCDALGCSAVILPAGPRTAEAAFAAARLAGWINVKVGGEARWVCPLQQTFDERLGRWVAKPFATHAPNRKKHR